MPIPLQTDLDAGGVARIQNLPDAVGAQEPATLAQLTAGMGATNPNVSLKDTDETRTGKVTTLASSTTKAGLALPHGAAPTSPVNGDIWSTASVVNFRLSGNTRTFLLDNSSLAAANLTGTLPALDGAALTNLNATNLASGTVALARLANIADAQIAAAAAIAWTKISKTGSSLADLTTRSATDLTSGTLPDARFPATLPALSGINLTALNGSNIASGTVADARLSANVPLINTTNTFTANQTFGSGARILGLPEPATAAEPLTLAQLALPSGYLVLGNSDWTRHIDTVSGSCSYSAPDKGMVLSGASTWAYLRLRLPVDPDSLYTVRVVMKKLTGTGAVYVGAKSLTNAFANLATDTLSSFNYFGASNVTIAAGATAILEGSIGGYNPASPTGGVASKFDPEANYWDLVLIANYGGSGTTVVQSIEILKQPTNRLVTAASTSVRAGLNLPAGVSPGTLVDGDMWHSSNALQVRLNGATHILLSHITNLNANNLGSGTVPLARLSGIGDAQIDAAAAIDWTKISKAGSSLADLATASAGDLTSGTLPDARFPATLPALSGANLTALNATNLTSGTVALARLSNIADAQIAAAAAIAWTKLSKAGSSLADLATRSATDLTSGTLPDARFPATLPALSGVNLTALNASNLASGTIADARLSANVALTNVDETFAAKVTTVASTTTKAGFNVPHGVAPTSPVNGDIWTTTAAALVRINAATRTFLLDNSSLAAANLTGTLPAISGVNLTLLNASNLGSGTVADARLSTNVPLLNAPNTFTANQITSGATGDNRLIARASGSVGGQGGFQLDQGSTYGMHAYATGTGGAAGTIEFKYKHLGTNVSQTGATFRFDGHLTLLSGQFTGNGAGLTNIPNSATTGVSAATPSTLALRDAAGRLQVVSPSATADAATKGYVDTAVAGVSAEAAPVDQMRLLSYLAM